MPILFILFVIIPIVEISVLIHVGGAIGGLNTLALVLLSAALGAYFVKKESVSTLQAAQNKLQHNELPAKELVTGACLLVAGVLLITPGFITDILGGLLIIPPTRLVIAGLVLKYVKVRVAQPHPHSPFQAKSHTQNQSRTQSQTQHSADGNVFEGEYTEQSHHEAIQSKDIQDDNNDKNL